MPKHNTEHNKQQNHGVYGIIEVVGRSTKIYTTIIDEIGTALWIFPHHHFRLLHLYHFTLSNQMLDG